MASSPIDTPRSDVVSSSPSADSEVQGAWSSDSGSSPGAAGPGSGVTRRLAWWRLVWCSERCHKEENAATRKLLAEAAQSAGGALVCLKKSSRYQGYLPRAAERGPHVLLTDWREAKPCLQSLRCFAQGSASAPWLVAVLNEQPKQLERIRQWASGLQAQGFGQQVQILQSLSEVPGLVAHAVATLQAAGKLAAPMVPPAVKPRDAVRLSLSRAISNGCGDLEDEPSTPPLCAPAFSAAYSRPVAAAPMPQPAQAVMGVLGSMFPGRSPEEMERLLTAAMPSRYDD